MKIELYEYGLDARLNDAVRILRSALGTKLSKKDKDILISEAIGIVETAQFMVMVSDPEQATDVGNE
jgi:hypothetical protein